LSPSFIQCPKCRNPLFQGVFDPERFNPCPACAAPLKVEVFPAFFRPIATGEKGETILTEGESSCFYHPQKKAAVACESCGRFVCSLCDCVLDERHLCPACLEAGRTKGKIKSLENSRIRYDNLALALALYPLIVFYLTIFSAPAVLFLVFRYRNAPLGITQSVSEK